MLAIFVIMFGIILMLPVMQFTVSFTQLEHEGNARAIAMAMIVKTRAIYRQCARTEGVPIPGACSGGGDWGTSDKFTNVIGAGFINTWDSSADFMKNNDSPLKIVSEVQDDGGSRRERANVVTTVRGYTGPATEAEISAQLIILMKGHAGVGSYNMALSRPDGPMTTNDYYIVEGNAVSGYDLHDGQPVIVQSLTMPRNAKP